ncbi:hypothetical protein F2Q69_00005563 [Brassica cretica]|uniref:Uncharacterized protein n=1 Tax=Brassica cretica TaxID=69181 RepID=A0A8S9P376_BRACR|nr:hypothetical protein F2Q69_00005563 [Brassica cretica]
MPEDELARFTPLDLKPTAVKSKANDGDIVAWSIRPPRSHLMILELGRLQGRRRACFSCSDEKTSSGSHHTNWPTKKTRRSGSVVPTRRRAPVVTTRIGRRRRRDAAAQVWRRCGLGEKAELRWSPHETKRSKLQSQTREEEDPSSCSNGGFARKMKKRSRQTRFPNAKRQTRF